MFNLLNYFNNRKKNYTDIANTVILKSIVSAIIQLSIGFIKGTEGVVVRDPKIPYINKRTSTALKVKRFKDAECEVIGHTEGKRKYQGLLGALECRLKNGIILKIGTVFTDNERRDPPKVGSTVTFKYQNMTKYGKPRFPVYLRVRNGKI